MVPFLLAGAGALLGAAAVLVSCRESRLLSIGFFDAGGVVDAPLPPVPDAAVDAPMPAVDGPKPLDDALPNDPTPVVCPPLAPAPVGYASVPTAALPSGTTGGLGGPTVVASTLQELTDYAAQTGPLVIHLATNFTGLAGTATLKVASNKTIEGTARGAGLTGVGLWVNDASNVIIRQLVIQKVPHDQGDCVTIQHSDHVWVDHCDFFSDRLQPSDAGVYDDLIDVVHASDDVTISWNNLHDNWHPTLVGHTASDAGAVEDRNHLTVTYHHNYFNRAGSYNPRVRFGTVHVYNNVFEDIETGIISQMSATVLVEGNIFDTVKVPITTGYDDPTQGAVAMNGSTNQFINIMGANKIETTAPWDPQNQLPYRYSADPADGSTNLRGVVTTCARPVW
jgi:pectate lyase